MYVTQSRLNGWTDFDEIWHRRRLKCGITHRIFFYPENMFPLDDF